MVTQTYRKRGYSPASPAKEKVTGMATRVWTAPIHHIARCWNLEGSESLQHVQGATSKQQHMREKKAHKINNLETASKENEPDFLFSYFSFSRTVVQREILNGGIPCRTNVRQRRSTRASFSLSLAQSGDNLHYSNIANYSSVYTGRTGVPVSLHSAVTIVSFQLLFKRRPI